MAILKCKMCGGNLEYAPDATVCECEYCGSKQTIPVVDDEKKISLYERANRLRFNCEFDKAAVIYESIVADFPEEAEAYWGLILCKYGIEYVDDPVDGKKVPTCHRSSFDSVMDDDDFELVMENSDILSRRVYREEAKKIEEIRKGIIKVSGNEQPYDIFICYKENDENGERTVDSVIAQEVYTALTNKGYRVFFSRISLEDKIGMEYEPYIFAALNSAKVMLAFGTSYDYYNAVWVKNEWSRFLKLMAKDKTKHLIPCYKDIDAYDIPKEFKHLQAQDMGKVGAIQDLLRGIDKLMDKAGVQYDEKAGTSKQELSDVVASVMASNTINDVEKLVERGYISLEDGEFEKADSLFENVLNKEPKCAEAYIGKWLCKIKKPDMKGLVDYYVNMGQDIPETEKRAIDIEPDIIQRIKKYYLEGYISEQEIRDMYKFDSNYTCGVDKSIARKRQVINEINNEKLYVRANNYASGKTKESIQTTVRNIEIVLDKALNDAKENEQKNIKQIKQKYEKWLNYKDKEMQSKYDGFIEYFEKQYQIIIENLENCNSIDECKKIIHSINELPDYKDLHIYKEKAVNELKLLEKERSEELERQKLAEIELKNKLKLAKKKKITKILMGIGATIIISLFVIVITKQITKNNRYNAANEMYDSGDYIGAIKEWQELGKYKDSSVKAKTSIDKKYEEAKSLMDHGQYEQAIEQYSKLISLKTVSREIGDCYYLIALSYYNVGNYADAIINLNNVEDSNYSVQDLLTVCECAQELSDIDDGDGHNLKEIYESIENIDSDIDLSCILDNKCIKMLICLNGTWQGVEKDGYRFYKYEFIIQNGWIEMKSGNEYIEDSRIKSSDILNMSEQEFYIGHQFSGAIYYKNGKYYAKYDENYDSYNYEIENYDSNNNTLEIGSKKLIKE